MPGRTGMRWGVRSRAVCHPDRLDMGFGLCKSCYGKQRYHNDGGKTKKQMIAYAKAHPEMRTAIMRKHAYGITADELHRLYKKQRGRCAICRKKAPSNKINVDHCHKYGHVRGLLCGHCNKALGLLFDRPDLLLSAYYYLILTRYPDMPRKKEDDAVAILKYFETAPLDSARTVLGLAVANMKKRTGEPKLVAGKRTKKPAGPGPAPATVGE